MRKDLTASIATLLLLVALSALPMPLLAAEAKPAAKSERKDNPQIQDLTYSRTYPFHSEDQMLDSKVSFTYVYEKVEPNSSRNAYNEALQAVDTYLVGLVSTQNPADKNMETSVKKVVNIQETTEGETKVPKIYSIKQAVEQASRSKKYEIWIDYYKLTVTVNADGEKKTQKDFVRQERQFFNVSGDGRAARVELHGVKCDVVALADQLFSAH